VKILDEAFLSITLDLVFVKGTFEQTMVQAISKRIGIVRNIWFDKARMGLKPPSDPKI